MENKLNLRVNQKSNTNIEKDNRNHILAPPNKQGTLNGQLKYWKGQKILPDDAMTIAALDLELKSLSYKIRPISKKPDQSRASHYFRSSIEKRLIGGLIVRNTLQNKMTQQSEIRDTFKLSKGLVSKVCLECIQEKWFKNVSNNNIQKYISSEMLTQSAKEFTKYVFEDVTEPVILEYLRRFTIKQLQNNLKDPNRVHGMNSKSQ